MFVITTVCNNHLSIVDLKQIVTSSAVMGLFRISKELQSGVYNHGECKSRAASRKELFYREEKEKQRLS